MHFIGIPGAPDLGYFLRHGVTSHPVQSAADAVTPPGVRTARVATNDHPYFIGTNVAPLRDS